MLSQESRIGGTGGMLCWIKERYCHLVHLHQVKHESEQRGMHFEARLVQSIGNDGKHILYQ